MTLTRVNTLLLLLIILINGYIIALPAIPGVVFWWQTRDGNTASTLQKKIQALTAPSKEIAALPKDNRLMIPAMAFDQTVFEGKTASTLNKGLWHRPNSSTPDKGSNTVFVGHRLTYTNPQGALYHLDKVKVGDPVGVWWKDKMYTYKVTDIKTVGPDEISVESPTDSPQLTIYTCTPLWLPKDRLVVIAKPEKL